MDDVEAPKEYLRVTSRLAQGSKTKDNDEQKCPAAKNGSGAGVDHRRKLSALPFSFSLGKTKLNLTKLNLTKYECMITTLFSGHCLYG
jgi:hypothetical protein